MEEILRAFNPWWEKEFPYPGIPRPAYSRLLSDMEKVQDVVIISGLRRVGKTTLLHQHIHDLIKGGADPKRILYVSLDNIALGDHSIHDIVMGFRKEQGLSVWDNVHLFLDEVHFKKDFELELKNLYDMGHSKVFASGSESMHIAMRTPYLTGRYRSLKVRPLDLKEFMDFKGLKVHKADEHLMERIANEYALKGGLPEYVLTEDLNYLNTTIEAILFRDILGRADVKDGSSILEILRMIARNVSTPLSVRKISRVLSHSEATVRKVISLFVWSDLVRVVERFGKFTERKVSPPKLYLSDTGFFRVLQERTNTGALVENLVLINLASEKNTNYYRGSNGEIDFISDGTGIEVKYRDDIASMDLKTIIEIKGLKRKIVITRSAESTNIEGIEAVPLWKFLLNKKP